MSRIAKVVEIIGTSEKNWDDAADNALAEASKTINNISGVQVSEMSANVENGEVSEYRTTLKIAFGVERAN